MNYIGSKESINWLFILACISALQWIVTIYYLYKKYPIIGTQIDNNAFNIKSENRVKDYINKIPFSKDYFYIYWNIYPIVFYAFFYYLDTSWDNYLNRIIMIGGDKAKEIYNSWFVTFDFFNLSIDYKYIDLIVIIVSLFFAYIATFGTQIKKQKQFIENREKLYWWDIRISKKIYWTRFIFLFFNIILVAFIAYLGLKVVLFIANILSADTLTINPFHPDSFGGLKVLMEIASVVLAIYLLRAVMGIVGLLDHKGVKDRLQLLGDLYHTSYLFFGIGFIVFFIYKIDNILGKIDISNLLNHQIYKTFSVCSDMNLTKLEKITCQNISKDKAIQIGSDMSNYYSNLLNFNKFPIDLALFTSSIFAFVLPLSLWFAISFFENRAKEISEIENSKESTKNG